MSEPATASGRQHVQVPAGRWVRWCDNFAARHGGAELRVERGALRGDGVDGSWFEARLPLGAAYDGPPEPAGFAAAVRPPAVWGVLLVRKGGFAVARLEGATTVESKVGQRHVQGRTKAGGQSQQRFARRRDNQARQAYEAAAGHAARILAPVQQVVLGGDRAAVEEVLADPRLRHVVPAGSWQAVPDPRRAVLDRTVTNVLSIQVVVLNA